MAQCRCILWGSRCQKDTRRSDQVCKDCGAGGSNQCDVSGKRTLARKQAAKRG